MRPLAPWGIAGGAVALLALIGLTAPTGQTPEADATPEGPWVYGAPEARFTLTTYADLECPYCRDAFPSLKAWIEAHPEVNWTWQHRPLPFHEPAAGREARLTECSGRLGGNGAFWQAVEQVFHQTRGSGQGLPGPLTLPGVDPQALEQCIAHDETIARTVRQQAAAASASGIEATPTLLLTDNQTGRSIRLEGAADAAALLSALDWLASAP